MATSPGLPLLPLLGVIVVCEFTPVDFWLQDLLYDPGAGRWLVDGNEPIGRALFYNGPKAALIVIAVALLALLAGPARWRAALSARGWRVDRRRLSVGLLTAGAVPAIVGWLKNHSGVYCPSELVRYGGHADFARPFSHLFSGGTAGHCWPAGHASGGFALLALTLLAGGDRQRRAVVGFALAFGGVMALYQMAKGAHFLSHTLVTLALAILFTRAAGWFLARWATQPAGGI